VQSLSSAILALQGIITKTKGFGIVVTKEQEGLVAKLEDELSHLQSSVAGLQTTN
jgi:DNA-binding transcriptional regulator YhcF (GntR family)